MSISENKCFATKKEKEEYLRRYRASISKEFRIIGEIEELEQRATYPSIALSEIRGCRSNSDLSRYAGERDERLRELEVIRQESASIRLDIKNRIDSMYDDYEKAVLHHRYITNMSWVKIAATIKYSEANTYRIYASALSNFPLKKNS